MRESPEGKLCQLGVSDRLCWSLLGLSCWMNDLGYATSSYVGVMKQTSINVPHDHSAMAYRRGTCKALERLAYVAIE
jgi:hypothetical protein